MATAHKPRSIEEVLLSQSALMTGCTKQAVYPLPSSCRSIKSFEVLAEWHILTVLLVLTTVIMLLQAAKAPHH